MYLFIYLLIDLFVYLFIYLFIYLYIYLFIYLFEHIYTGWPLTQNFLAWRAVKTSIKAHMNKSVTSTLQIITLILY